MGATVAAMCESRGVLYVDTWDIINEGETDTQTERVRERICNLPHLVIRLYLATVHLNLHHIRSHAKRHDLKTDDYIEYSVSPSVTYVSWF